MSRLVTLTLLLVMAGGSPARPEEQIRIDQVPPPPAFQRTLAYRLPVPKETPGKKPEAPAEVEGFAYSDVTDLWICNVDGSSKKNLSNFADNAKYKDCAAKVKPGKLVLIAFRFAPKKARFYCLVVGSLGKWRFYFEVAADGSGAKHLATRQVGSMSKDYKERRKFTARAAKDGLTFHLAHAELAPLVQQHGPYVLAPDLKKRVLLYDQSKFATDILFQDNAADPEVHTDRAGTGHEIRIPCRSIDKKRFISVPGRRAFWSPDGKWVAVRFERFPHFCLVAADRSEIRTYFTHSVPKETDWRERRPDATQKGKVPIRAFHDGSLHWLRDFGVPAKDLRWSPDGKYLCFYTFRMAGAQGQDDFALVRVEDGRAVLVENPHSSYGHLHHYDYSFSPDGKSVAMTLLPQKGTWQYRVFVADVARLFAEAKKPVTYVKMDDARLEAVGPALNGTMRWFGTGKEKEEFVGTRLVLPAKSRERGELTATKARHDTLERNLASAVESWQSKPTEALRKKLADLRHRIQAEEREFFSVVTDVSGDFAYAEIDEQSRAWHDRVTYLQRVTVSAYDALRKYDYGTYLVKHDQYELEEGWYKQCVKDLLRTLRSWNGYNATLLQRYEMAAREIELEARGQGFVGNPAALVRTLAQRKVAVHIDQAERAVIEAHVMREAALLYQRSYFHAIRAERDKQAGFESPTYFDGAVRYTFLGAKYFISSMSAIWSGMLDLLAVTWIPTDARRWLGLTTISEKLDLTVRAHRETTASRIAALDGLRKLGPAEYATLRDYLREALALPPAREALKPLHEDRHFHEATDGGLFRVAGAFDATLHERLCTEQAAAAHHARLVARDLERSLNVQMGRLPEGDFTFKALLDPMKFMEGIARSERGEWAQKEGYLATRRALVKKFVDDLDTWRARGFAIEGAAAHAKTGDLTAAPEGSVWRTHMLLAQKLPSYIDFLVRRKLLVFDAERLALQALRDTTRSEARRREIDHLIEMKQMTLQFTLRPLLARAQMLQGADRIFCRDYPGGLALLERAAKTDPTVIDGKRLKALEKDLARMRIKETGIDVFHDIGNNCAYTLLLGRVTGGKGFAFGKPITFQYFVWMMASPFDGASTVGGVFNIFLNATKMVAARGVAGVGVKALDAAGADGEYYRQYLDLLAVALVQKGARHAEEAAYPYLERGFGAVAKKLATKVEEIEGERAAGRLDAEAETARAGLRDRLADWIDVVKRLKELRDYSQQLERSYKLKTAEVAVLRGKVASIEEFLYLRSSPTNGRVVLQALSRYRTATRAGFDPEAARELFSTLSIQKLRAFKQNRDFFKKNPAIEQELDAARCDLAAAARKRVAMEFKEWVEYIAPSGTPPGNAEYRLLDSDNDYTFLLKSNTPEHIRKQIEAAFPEEFGRLLDSNAFADRMPDMNRITSIDRYNRQFRTQVKNPERYVLPGMVRVIPLVLFRKAGILYKVKGDKIVTLSAAETDHVFRNIDLEEWMGADVIMDQCRFIDHYWSDFKAGRIDGLKFLKAQAKYSLRALLGSNISDPMGARLHNAFVPSSDETFHKSIVDIAGRLASSDANQARLAREWFALKTGKAPAQAFAERMRSESISLRLAADRHLAETSAALKDFLARAKPVQQSYLDARWRVVSRMRERRPLAELIKDPMYRKAEFEYYSVICSQAWLLARFSPEDLAWAKGFSTVASQHVSDANTDVTTLASWYDRKDREKEASKQ